MNEGPWSVIDEVSLVQCYDQSVARVYRYASRFTAGDRPRTDDLVRDVYVALVRAARDGEIDEVGTEWLIAAVRRRFLDGLGGEQRDDRRSRPAAPATSIEIEVDMPELAVLPDRERAALVLRYLDDLPVGEVAALMGLSVHATESLVARARKRMRLQEARDA